MYQAIECMAKLHAVFKGLVRNWDAPIPQSLAYIIQPLVLLPFSTNDPILIFTTYAIFGIALAAIPYLHLRSRLQMTADHLTITASIGGLGMALGSALDLWMKPGTLCRDPSLGVEQWLASGMMVGMMLTCVPLCARTCRIHRNLTMSWQHWLVSLVSGASMIGGMYAAHALDKAYPYYLLRDPGLHHLWMVIFMAVFGSLALVGAVSLINREVSPPTQFTGIEREE